MKRIISLLAVLMIAALAIVPMTASAATTAYVYAANGKDVNVRSSMITHCNNRVDLLPVGKQVTVLSTTGEWSYIQFTHTTTGRTTTGYIQSRYLTTNTNKVGVTTEGMMIISPTTATVRPSSPTGFVNMRAAASKASTVKARYYQGQTLTVTAVGSTWCQVYDPSTGRSGYMMKRFLNY